MFLTRRKLLAACAGTAVLALDDRRPGSALGGPPSPSSAGPAQPLGVVIHSYTQRVAAARGGSRLERFDDALVFLEHCHTLGARGVQVGIGVRDEADCERLRGRAAALGMDLEGIVRLPRDRDDLERFGAELQSAKRAGATVVRTAILSGRRFETFATAAAFQSFADGALRSLALAEPAAARAGVRLAVENHKDWRADELVAIVKRIESAHIGVCVDTGNSIALLEDPMEVVEALAPWAVTTHLKDMAVQEYDKGFLLAEVPLGEGFLDIRRMVRTLRTARPEIRLNLEMITRDPLEVPCLTDKYWATFENLSGRHLARSLTMVRTRGARQSLPRISGLSVDAKLQAEEENVRRSFAFARAELSS
jgi:sugar phosphate isomerase/epimerase